MGGFGFGLGRDEFRRGPGAGERGTGYRIAIVIVYSSFRYKRRELPLSCRDSRPENSNGSRITTDPPLALLCFLKSTPQSGVAGAVPDTRVRTRAEAGPEGGRGSMDRPAVAPRRSRTVDADATKRSAGGYRSTRLPSPRRC